MELDQYDIEMMMMNVRNVGMLRIHQFGMLQHYPLFNSKCGVVLCYAYNGYYCLCCSCGLKKSV